MRTPDIITNKQHFYVQANANPVTRTVDFGSYDTHLLQQRLNERLTEPMKYASENNEEKITTIQPDLSGVMMILIKRKYKSIVCLLGSVVIFSLLSIFPITTMAIVNMDGLHFDNKKDTFTADLDLTVSGSSGNSNTAKTALNAQFSWIAEKSINLAILGYQYGKSNDVRSANKAFIHYRYIYQLNNTIDWELFGQLETNEFTRLSYRGLLGSGIRFSVAKSEQHHAFLGVGGFYSKEKIKFTSGLTDDGVEEFTRANFYFLSKYRVNPEINFANVLYYQPHLSRFSDYRALLETKFDFKINEDLSFRLSLDIEYDSEPSQAIKSTDVGYMSGLVFNF